MTYVLVAAGTIAAVGAATSYVNARNTANRQDSALAASLRQQGQLQDQGNTLTKQLISKTAASTPDAAQGSLLTQFTNELNAKKALATGGLNQVGKVSDAYTQAANDAQSGITNFGNQRAGLISAIDAPMLQRQGEGENLSTYATQLNQLKDQSAAQQFLTQMRLKGIAPNPWLTALSGISSGVASGLANSYTGGGGGSTGSGYLDGGGTVSGGTNLPFRS